MFDDDIYDSNAISHCLDVSGFLIVDGSRICLCCVWLGVSKVRERSQYSCFRETQLVYARNFPTQLRDVLIRFGFLEDTNTGIVPVHYSHPTIHKTNIFMNQ